MRQTDETLVVGTTADTRLPRNVFDGLTLIEVGLNKLLHADLDTRDLHTALELIKSVEHVGRKMDAVQVETLDSIDATGVHTIDGHRTGKVMVAHLGQLSGPEANSRRQVMTMLRAMPEVRTAYHAGQISTPAVRRLGRAYANRRVRDLMVDADDWFADHARDDTYEMFNLVVSHWVELADADGTIDKDRRAHEDRNHTMTRTKTGHGTSRAGAPLTKGPLPAMCSMRSYKSSSRSIGDGRSTRTDPTRRAQT